MILSNVAMYIILSLYIIPVLVYPVSILISQISRAIKHSSYNRQLHILLSDKSCMDKSFLMVGLLQYQFQEPWPPPSSHIVRQISNMYITTLSVFIFLEFPSHFACGFLLHFVCNVLISI